MKDEVFFSKWVQYELANSLPNFIVDYEGNEIAIKVICKTINNFLVHLKTIKVTKSVIVEVKNTHKKIEETIESIKRREDFHKYINLLEFLKGARYQLASWLLQSEKNAQFFVEETLHGPDITPEVREVLADDIIRGPKGHGVVDSMSIRSESLSSVLRYTLSKLERESKELKEVNDERERSQRKFLRKKGYSDYSLSKEEPKSTSTLDLIRRGRLTLKMRDE